MSFAEKLHSLSLRWQICFLLVASLCVCLLITGALAYSQSRNVIIELTLDKVMAETNEAVSELDHIMQSTRVDAVSTPTFPPIPGMIRCWDNDGITDPKDNSTFAGWVSQLTDILSSQMEAHPERVRCTVYRDSGDAVMQVVSIAGKPQLAADGFENIAEQEHFVKAIGLKRGQTYVAPIRRDEPEKYVRVCTPFFSSLEATDREARGLFVITLDGRKVLAAAAKSLRSGDVSVVDETGAYLMPEKPKHVRYSDDYPVRARLMSSSDPSADSYTEYVDGRQQSGTAVLATYRKFFYDPSDRTRFWLVAPSVPAENALLPASQLANSILIAGLVVLFGAGAIAFVLLGRLTTPLQQLAQSADRVASGQLDTPLPESHPIGEVKALYHSIGRMTTKLRAMIDAASAEEARTRAIFDSTADAIVTIDERGNVLSCNATTATMFGHSPSWLVAQKASVLVPSLYQEDADYEHRELAPGETRQLGSEIETIGRHRDGHELPIAMRITELAYAGQRLYIATMQDISVRKQAREERHQLFAAIRGAVSRLAAGTHQILATTTQQATGAQEQAAAVAQTVATVDEVAQTADQSTQRANAVAEAAKKAEVVGRAGRQAVDESVVSMGIVRDQVQSIAENIQSLAERAQAIGDIIATVNDIAEQTNILALNAAVEASRAGEHGKGFAVVATEVKELAAQSKKATKQVRRILREIELAMETAVSSTNKGTVSVTKAAQIVAKTGETINSLEEMLSHSARTATQISASAGQQATGVIQLNEAIKNIDRVTRQNVEAIQQIEASAHSLDALSNELAGLTSNG
ncbi:MAG: methyl-accepting chemotaxis protein [Planctomycetota bacterium]